MKRIALLFLIILMFLLSGCDWENDGNGGSGSAITFEEVSQSYLDQYGQPGETSGSGGSIWWTWDLADRMLTVFFHENYQGDWKVAGEEYWYTFEQISKPYLDQYGPPEDLYEYESPDYHSIDWWWWSRGFEVTFLWTTYDDVRGWVVDSTYSFPPF